MCNHHYFTCKINKTYSHPVCPLWFPAFSALLSLPFHHCYSCQKTKSKLHTPILTVVHREVVCAPKILPFGIFLTCSFRSTSTLRHVSIPKLPAYFAGNERFNLHFQVRFSLAMLLTIRLDTATEETWVRGQFSTSSQTASGTVILSVVYLF